MWWIALGIASIVFSGFFAICIGLVWQVNDSQPLNDIPDEVGEGEGCFSVFWTEEDLGASAVADRATHEPNPQAVSALTGECPSRGGRR